MHSGMRLVRSDWAVLERGDLRATNTRSLIRHAVVACARQQAYVCGYAVRRSVGGGGGAAARAAGCSLSEKERVEGTEEETLPCLCYCPGLARDDQSGLARVLLVEKYVGCDEDWEVTDNEIVSPALLLAHSDGSKIAGRSLDW